MYSDKIFTIKADKRNAITNALLTEFSNYSLADSQVARIVKDANISRGAFYNYFKDLSEAYQYLYGLALKDIHSNITHNPTLSSVDFVNEVRSFLKSTKKSTYYHFIQMHYRYNESYVAKRVVPADSQNNIHWAQTVLSHEVIRDSLLQPSTTNDRLKQLSFVLEKLED
ncbi:TetR/AcrR family transcriptional regulator [Pediococcus claussenii]|uniref:TetR/AcrR family transcriptional regulator n=1 Tax=Pediococcus claussenii TaxID=187452 RepID=UPI00081AA932|nr:TetR/AcrR family transcriptional regulator [Pediococcus claussenii]ANZ69221.1 hypothetical protein AYR57_02410 [Pediococcus claussenii]ANZ71040.1 hypothetical protein AYR58_02425 [Pediococcus claussenii]